MGTDRSPRPSEETFGIIWSKMRNLCVCVWSGKSLTQDAEEIALSLKRDLDQMIEQMKEEN